MHIVHTINYQRFVLAIFYSRSIIVQQLSGELTTCLECAIMKLVTSFKVQLCIHRSLSVI